jgi:hypothetical protein
MADTEGTEAVQGKRLVMDSHLQLQQRAMDRRDETRETMSAHGAGLLKASKAVSYSWIAARWDGMWHVVAESAATG